MATTKRLTGFVMASIIVVAVVSCGGSATNPPANVTSSPPVAAAATCPEIVKTALDAIGTRCNEIGSNQVCYGNARLEVTTASNAVVFNNPGDKAKLSDLKTLHTTPLDAQNGTWGIAVLRAAVNLPGTTAGQQVTFLMYGDTTLDSFSADMKTVSFRTNIGQQACDEVPPSGLTVQVPKGQHITFTANGAEITLGSTAILQAVPDQQLSVSVLEGQGEVKSQGVSQPVNAGLQVKVPLKGDVVSAPPSKPQPIPVNEVKAAPVQVLSEPVNLTQVATVIQAASTQISQPLTATPTQGIPGTPLPSITPLLTWTPGPTLGAGGSGAGNRIVFASNRGGNWEIYVMNADGSSQTQLTNQTTEDRSPAWAPDGAHIVFTSNTGQVSQLFVMNADGSSSTPLTQADQSADHAAWSPNGARIVFDSLQGNNRDIWIMDTNGANAQALASNPSDDSEPAWSPDGSRIVFVSARDGNKEIYVMNADGSGVTRLTDNPVEDRAPHWSPDGSKIVFVSARTGNDAIYVMDADGKNVQRITTSLAKNDTPIWSPDGSQIAYVSSQDGAQAIYVINANGDRSSIRRLTDPGSDSINPAWQR